MTFYKCFFSNWKCFDEKVLNVGKWQDVLIVPKGILNMILLIKPQSLNNADFAR